ncbi:MAG TPA: SMR family transporter [Alphaproteobacteria bacterium]|nr:SMR family transporter [Alphaproteobacteria bacterium]
MAWLYLLCGSVCEVGWFLLVKAYGLSFARPLPSLAALLLMMGGPVLFSFAIKTLPTAIAYPVFLGINTTAVLLACVLFLGEKITPPQFLCITLIVAGIIGLRLLENAPAR